MNLFLRVLFLIVLVFLTYHLVRDVLQILGVENLFTLALHRPHAWCQNSCNFVTFPFQLGGILGATFILKRNKVGIIGVFVLLIPVAILLGTLLP